MNRDIDKIIRMIWDSLESHLPYTYEDHPDGIKHHVQCVKEYAQLIELVTHLYPKSYRKPGEKLKMTQPDTVLKYSDKEKGQE